MNFIENESPTKLRGGYYTDPTIARFLTRWVLAARPRRVLEPSCGDGVFIDALASLPNCSVEEVVAFEIEPAEAEKARGRVPSTWHARVDVQGRDFLGWALIHLMVAGQFDAVLGNPPFIRYQYLDPELQNRSQLMFEMFRLPFTRHTNAWVPFVAASVSLLRPGGRLAMVVPAEVLHILHAQSLREHLARQCARVLIFDPAELWFENVLQGAVLLLAERKRSHDDTFRGVGIVRTRERSFLDGDPERLFQTADYVDGPAVAKKWMPALLTKSERDLISAIVDDCPVRLFRDVADVDVGIVTGANKFFLVPDAVVRAYDLQPWAHPMFGRSEHVPGVLYDHKVHEGNRRAGLPTNFLWFRAEDAQRFPPRARDYIDQGEGEGLHYRYKCSIRDPWYAVPSVYAAPVGLLKRCHDFPRLILNRLDALTTDTAYRIKPRLVPPAQLVESFVNSLTALFAELEGRHYGGGVLELVPSEIERLAVPCIPPEPGTLQMLDQRIRDGVAPELVLAEQDGRVLAPAGVSCGAREELLAAWLRLRNRRQRTETTE